MPSVLRHCSSPDSGWFRARAISGAGTASRLPPMRRPARRAGKNRLADIEAEIQAVRREVEAKQNAVAAAAAAVASSAEAEAAARARWRTLQHEADAARDRHAEAEREVNRNAARLSALGE